MKALKKNQYRGWKDIMKKEGGREEGLQDISARRIKKGGMKGIS